MVSAVKSNYVRRHPLLKFKHTIKTLINVVGLNEKQRLIKIFLEFRKMQKENNCLQNREKKLEMISLIDAMYSSFFLSFSIFDYMGLTCHTSRTQIIHKGHFLYERNKTFLSPQHTQKINNFVANV